MSIAQSQSDSNILYLGTSVGHINVSRDGGNLGRATVLTHRVDSSSDSTQREHVWVYSNDFLPIRVYCRLSFTAQSRIDTNPR